MLKKLGNNVLHTGDYVTARTHAEFLNKTFGTNYKQWMKSVWYYNSGIFVWMVRFDGDNRSGWVNEFVDDDTIRETNVYKKSEWDRKPITNGVPNTRIVIEVVDGLYGRKYIFRGVFKTDEENSDWYNVRIHKKISDSFRYE